MEKIESKSRLIKLVKSLAHGTHSGLAGPWPIRFPEKSTKKSDLDLKCNVETFRPDSKLESGQLLLLESICNALNGTREAPWCLAGKVPQAEIIDFPGAFQGLRKNKGPLEERKNKRASRGEN